MGRHPVRDCGPVLVYCIEDGKHGVRDRMEGLCEARGLDFEKLGIGWIDAEELTLDRPEDQLRLHATVAKNRAKAIVLDPLVRLHLGDKSSSQDISRLLRFLRSLQRQHDTRRSAMRSIGSSTSSPSASWTTRSGCPDRRSRPHGRERDPPPLRAIESATSWASGRATQHLWCRRGSFLSEVGAGQRRRSRAAAGLALDDERVSR